MAFSGYWDCLTVFGCSTPVAHFIQAEEEPTGRDKQPKERHTSSVKMGKGDDLEATVSQGELSVAIMDDRQAVADFMQPPACSIADHDMHGETGHEGEQGFDDVGVAQIICVIGRNSGGIHSSGGISLVLSVE